MGSFFFSVAIITPCGKLAICRETDFLSSWLFSCLGPHRFCHFYNSVSACPIQIQSDVRRWRAQTRHAEQFHPRGCRDGRRQSGQQGPGPTGAAATSHGNWTMRQIQRKHAIKGTYCCFTAAFCFFHLQSKSYQFLFETVRVGLMSSCTCCRHCSAFTLTERINFGKNKGAYQHQSHVS